MAHSIIRREEMIGATLSLGGAEIELDDYATTGLMAVTVAPRGYGKTNTGLLMAEQLSDQGWVSVLIDPEGELESLYGDAVRDVAELEARLKDRTKPIVVVSAPDASAFVPYGEAILEAADKHRKPLFVVVDEGQLFSAPRKRKDDIGEAADIINHFAERGRKRALDFFITAHGYTGTLHRSVFRNKNLTLVGCQEDPTAWAALAAQFRASRLEFKDLNALGPGEFFCFSRRGVEKVRVPLAKALRKVAPTARKVKPALPKTFVQWCQAMDEIPTERLQALTDPVTSLLGAVCGLSAQQIASGNRALADELGGR